MTRLKIDQLYVWIAHNIILNYILYNNKYLPKTSHIHYTRRSMALIKHLTFQNGFRGHVVYNNNNIILDWVDINLKHLLRILLRTSCVISLVVFFLFFFLFRTIYNQKLSLFLRNRITRYRIVCAFLLFT